MSEVIVIGGGGKSWVTAMVLAKIGMNARVASHKGGTRYDVLAIDECAAIAPSVGKANKGKGQRKANRANRWR